MTRRNTALLSALSVRNRPKTITGLQIQPREDEAAVISVEDPRNMMRLKQCHINVDVFYDTKRIKNLFHQGRLNRSFCNILRQLNETNWLKHLVKWCNNSWALCLDNAPAHILLASRPPPSLLTRPCCL